MAAGTKTPPKPKVQPKPKFGEVGYEFNLKAKIVEVYPEEDKDNYPFHVAIDLGEFEDYEDEVRGKLVVSYPTKQDLLNVVASTAPSILKTIKLEELNKARADVDRITKELAALKWEIK